MPKLLVVLSSALLLTSQLYAMDFIGGAYRWQSKRTYSETRFFDQIGLICEDTNGPDCEIYGVYSYHYDSFRNQGNYSKIDEFAMSEIDRFIANVFDRFKKSVRSDNVAAIIPASRWVISQYSHSDGPLHPLTILTGASMLMGAAAIDAIVTPVSIANHGITRFRTGVFDRQFKNKFRKYLNFMMDPNNKGQTKKLSSSRFSAFSEK